MDYQDFRTLLEQPARSMMRGILNAAPIAAGLGLDGKIVYANPAFATLWGYDHSGQMLGRSLFEILSPASREFVTKLWHLSADHFTPWEYELEGIKADGSLFAYRITSMAFETEMGRATFAFFVPVESAADPDEQMSRLVALLDGDTPDQDKIDFSRATL